MAAALTALKPLMPLKPLMQPPKVFKAVIPNEVRNLKKIVNYIKKNIIFAAEK